MSDSDEVLRLDHVTKIFSGRKGLTGRSIRVRAVHDVTLTVRRRETLGLVGESGSGKSTLARIALRLLDPTEGRVFLRGREITRAGERELRPLRRDMAMIFQDPYTSLNPRHTVGKILANVARNHHLPRDKAALVSVLEQVGLSTDHFDRYPHQFSGGQRQRIGIARALVTQPSLLVADEPVSALDVSVRAQVLNLLSDLRDEHDLALMVVAHDLAVVRTISDYVAVMYLGTVVEFGAADEVYADPQHPYTQTLMSSVPVPDPHRRIQRIRAHGELSSASAESVGCPFASRCPRAQDRCQAERPALVPINQAGAESTEAPRVDLDTLSAVQRREHTTACFYPGPLSD